MPPLSALHLKYISLHDDERCEACEERLQFRMSRKIAGMAGRKWEDEQPPQKQRGQGQGQGKSSRYRGRCYSNINRIVNVLPSSSTHSQLI